MASAARTLRLCMRSARYAPVPRKQFAPRMVALRRDISTTPTRWQPKKEEDEQEEEDDDAEGDERGDAPGSHIRTGVFPKEAEYEDMISHMSFVREKTGGGALTPKEREALLHQLQAQGSADEIMQNLHQLTQDNEANFPRMPSKPPKSATFWNDEEPDPENWTDEQNEDPFDENDITGLGHAKFEEFRDFREYARLAAWQMPLLSKLAKPFVPPTADQPLRFRYTSYMGELHPAESKVVVEFSPQDLGLNEAQQLKLKKILGARYNPDTDIAKMSCEQFEHQAQNKRYLGDVVDSLVAKAKDPTDMFEDVPLDTRHHESKVKHKFPKEWRLTEERRKALDDTREKSYLIDQQKEAEGGLIDGPTVIQNSFYAKAAAEPVYVRAPAKAGPKATRRL